MPVDHAHQCLMEAAMWLTGPDNFQDRIASTSVELVKLQGQYLGKFQDEIDSLTKTVDSVTRMSIDEQRDWVARFVEVLVKVSGEYYAKYPA